MLRWDRRVYPMAIARDAATGEVRAFARDGELVLPAGAEAIDLIVSDGVGSTTRRITTPR